MMKDEAVRGSDIVLMIGWPVFQETASPGGMSPTPDRLTYHCNFAKASADRPVNTSYMASNIVTFGHVGSAEPDSLPAGL
jgi:hypothetical protein